MQTLQTNVKKWGNSLAIRIPNAIVENLKLNDNTPLDIKVSKNKIILSKKEELSHLLGKINDDNLHTDDFSTPRGKEW
ncbi:AbrB/MazE/SpoVT family DNA-binding domain-containing protein [Helicobacter macacae]|uniref:SpoVT-AbrB domain-containing protein n=1 Tax=Helicobacter macacae MIT 99-5501 TaxID=1357400 RepID=V8C8F6_9HELI|nr:AbrB/MazE/SpoVT family DNA-binding domain-containing protein [Helicobacter macacae]ETD23011.1 hypothetical protein HMPREF2086_01458 [Helicobacter macacae MIT 99-5501]